MEVGAQWPMEFVKAARLSSRIVHAGCVVKLFRFFLGAMFALCLIWLILMPREPSYQGKHLTEWLELYSTNRFPFDKEAESAIRHFGAAGPPIFLAKMTTRESRIRLDLMTHVPKPVLRALHIPSGNDYRARIDHERQLGAYGFAASGPEARPFVPDLMALLNDKEPRVRYLTVFALRSLGPVASEALPSLIKCLDDPDFTIRDDAIASLGTIHEQPGRIVPIITNFLEKNRSNLILRGDAIRSLGSFGADAKAAVPMISGFLNDNNEEVRSEASNALGRIDPTFARKAAVQ
jgi:hypothetical protein